MDSLTFGGTATTLLRLGAFTVLTDPNFLHRGQRAYLGKGLWSRRLTEPAGQSLVGQLSAGRDDQLGVLAKVFAVRRDGRGVGARRPIGRAVWIRPLRRRGHRHRVRGQSPTGFPGELDAVRRGHRAAWPCLSSPVGRLRVPMRFWATSRSLVLVSWE